MIINGRIDRGVKCSVHISHGETLDWHDLEERERIVSGLKRVARARGKRYLQIFDCDGKPLLMTEVG